jgi:hypothetical protein
LPGCPQASASHSLIVIRNKEPGLHEVPQSSSLLPFPILFPHIAGGGGYETEFIFLDAASGGSLTINYLDAAGKSLAGFTPQKSSSSIVLNSSSAAASFGGKSGKVTA